MIQNHLKRKIIGLFSLLALCSPISYAQDDVIDWQPCLQEVSPHFSCGTLSVPLDHGMTSPKEFYQTDNHSMEIIDIALMRYSEPGDIVKQGSILFNPGGPGGSGVDFVSALGPYFISEELRQTYDLIGFDPRGTNRSQRLQCLNADIDDVNAFFPIRSFPIDFSSFWERRQLDKAYTGICRQQANSIIHHMSTADVAKDMEYIRIAVGDTKLNYAGYSYGTYLGATYANLFPENVGRMLLDAALDPIAYSTGYGDQSEFWPVFARTGGPTGATETLDEFFRLCEESPDQCSFAGHAKQRFKAMAQRLKDGPPLIIVDQGQTTEVNYQLFVAVMMSELYNSDNWVAVADLLSFVEAQLFQPMSEGESENIETLPIPSLLLSQEPHALSYFEGQLGSLCTDTDNPSYPVSWLLSAFYLDEALGYFGSPWVWISSPCQSWPGSKDTRYTGPFHYKTANTVLIVNTLFDPATPYQGAEKLRNIMPNSHLLTIDGWGHGSLFLSECVDETIHHFFIGGSLPASEKTCRQDVVPFGGSYSLSSKEEKEAQSVAPEMFIEDPMRVTRKALREAVLSIMKPF